MLVIVFFRTKMVYLSAEQVTVNCDCYLCVGTGRPCYPFLFFAISICLSFAGLGWVKLKWTLCTVLCKSREVFIHCVLNFLVRGIFLSESSLLAQSNSVYGGGGWIMQAKWNCLHSVLCVVFSDFFVLLKFLQRTT